MGASSARRDEAAESTRIHAAPAPTTPSPLARPGRWLTTASIVDLSDMDGYAWDAQLLLRLSGADRVGEISARRTVFIPDLDDMMPAVTDDFWLPDTWGRALGHRLREAVKRRHTLWIGLVNEENFHILSGFIGPGILHIAGTQSEQTGLLPVALNPIDLITLWSSSPTRAAYLRSVLDGVDTLRATRSAIRALGAARVDTRVRSRAARLTVNPTFIAYAVVFIYSSLRALPVVFVPGFKGNVAVLWSIDIITAIPYTWGILAMVAGRNRFIRFAGLTVTVVTFIAPYVYFWVHGRHSPPAVLVFVAAMIVGAIALELGRWWRDRLVNDWLVR